jgi:hypothetical protein
VPRRCESSDFETAFAGTACQIEGVICRNDDGSAVSCGPVDGDSQLHLQAIEGR